MSSTLLHAFIPGRAFNKAAFTCQTIPVKPWKSWCYLLRLSAVYWSGGGWVLDFQHPAKGGISQ